MKASIVALFAMALAVTAAPVQAGDTEVEKRQWNYRGGAWGRVAEDEGKSDISEKAKRQWNYRGGAWGRVAEDEDDSEVSEKAKRQWNYRGGAWGRVAEDEEEATK